MRTTAVAELSAFALRLKNNLLAAAQDRGIVLTLLPLAADAAGDPPASTPPRTWPQAYSVKQQRGDGHPDSPHALLHRRAGLEKRRRHHANRARRTGRPPICWSSPLATRVRDENGAVLSDLNDPATDRRALAGRA